MRDLFFFRWWVLGGLFREREGDEEGEEEEEEEEEAEEEEEGRCT